MTSENPRKAPTEPPAGDVVPHPRGEPDENTSAAVPADAEPDVLLNVPELKIDEIRLEVEDLRARVSLQAEVLDLLRLNVGADVALGRVDLTIKGVEAQALLKVRLDRVAAIVNRVLTTVDRNPEILEHVTRGAGRAVGDLGRGAGRAVGDLGRGAGRAVEEVGEGAEQAVGDLGRGAGGALEQVSDSAGQAVGELGRGTSGAVEGVGKGAGRAAEGVGSGAGRAVEGVTEEAGETAGRVTRQATRRSRPAGRGQPERRRGGSG